MTPVCWKYEIDAVATSHTAFGVKQPSEVSAVLSCCLYACSATPDQCWLTGKCQTQIMACCMQLRVPLSGLV